MGSTQKNSPPRDDGSGPNAAKIDLLQSRFAALSHLAAINPTQNLPRLQGTYTAPTGHHEQAQSEISFDHHTPPYEDLDISCKRQKGPQDVFKFSIEQASVPHTLNLLASPFNDKPVNTLNDSVITTSDIDISVLEPTRKPLHGSMRGRKSRAKKKHSAARKFLGHSDGSSGTQEFEELTEAEGLAIEENTEDTKTEVLKEIQDIKVKNTDEKEGLQISMEVTPEASLAGVEPVAGELRAPRIGGSLYRGLPHIPVVETAFLETGTTNFVPKSGSAGFKPPEVILQRYPKMAKYLSAVTAQESVMKQAVSTSSAIRDAITIQPSILLQKSDEKKTEDLDKQKLVAPSQDENIKPIFVPHSDKLKTTNFQRNIGEPRIVLPVYLGSFAGVEDRLESKAHFTAHDTKRSQSISSRPTLPERYAIPIMAQNNELAAQQTTVKPSYYVPRIEKTRQLPEEDSLMEQLALIDERFSKESEDSFFGSGMPDFCLSQSSSRLAEGSITVLSSPNLPGSPNTGIVYENKGNYRNSIPVQTPRQADGANLEDSDRFRRSRGPSPSPHTSRSNDASTTNPEKLFVGEEKQTKEWKSVAENWLDQFTNSVKPIPFPRSQPSVLARMHQVLSPTSDVAHSDTGGVGTGEDEDSDGIAPGEWIQPVGLPKKQPTKAKIGITAELTPVLLQPASASVVKSAPGSAATSVAGSVQRGQWIKAAPSQSNNPYSKKLFSGSNSSVGRDGLDAITSRSEFSKAGTIEEAEAREKVIMEWRERGFTEVGRMDEIGFPNSGSQQVKQQTRKPSGVGLFRSDGRESEAGDSGNSERETWKAPREGGLFPSPSRTGATSTRVEKHMVADSGSGRTHIQSRMVFGRGASPIPIQSSVHQQLVDPNVQELANILRGIQTTQGIKPKDFLAPQASKDPQAPHVPRSSAARQTLTAAPNPAAPRVSMAYQAPTATPAPMALHIPKTMPRKVSVVEQPVVSAYVRKLCPFFFAGRCIPGQNCPDLHPNYDEQSGTFVEKRFTTQDVFEKEALVRAEKEREREKALEVLIQQSRDEADRKCHDSISSTTRRGARNIQVAGGIVIGKNAKGEKDWIIMDPPSQKPIDGVEESSGPTSASLPRAGKNHR